MATEIKNQIDRITANIASTYAAAGAKGATMPETQNSDNLAATVLSIKSAGEVDTSGFVQKSGDTMTGALIAQNNTNYTVKQVRNIFLIADGETLPSGGNGDICLVYTP